MLFHSILPATGRNRSTRFLNVFSSPKSKSNFSGPNKYIPITICFSLTTSNGVEVMKNVEKIYNAFTADILSKFDLSTVENISTTFRNIESDEKCPKSPQL